MSAVVLAHLPLGSHSSRGIQQGGSRRVMGLHSWVPEVSENAVHLAEAVEPKLWHIHELNGLCCSLGVTDLVAWLCLANAHEALLYILACI